MDTLKDKSGRATSITIPGLTDWDWAPSKNILVYTSNVISEDERNE